MDVSSEWTPHMAAIELTGGLVHEGSENWKFGDPAHTAPRSRPVAGKDELKSLERRIHEAILTDELTAERREPTGVYRQNDAYRLVRGPQCYLKPKDVIKWALDNDIDVPLEYRKWYSDITKQKRKPRQTGPRDSTKDRVIVAMAKALGYLPAEGKKAAQGKLAAILNHDDKLDAGTLKKVVQAALEASQEKD